MRHYLSVYCRFRDEAKWLPEWLEYHLLIGVEHFYLIDHLSVDNPESILQPYIERGLVTLARWEKELPKPDHSRGFIAMGHKALEMARGQTKWLAVIDTDEFIVVPGSKSLTDLLKGYERHGGVAMNWQMFGTSEVEQLGSTDLLLEQLTHRGSRDFLDNKHIKVIVQPEFVKSLEIHNAQYTSFRYRTVNTNSQPVSGPFNLPILTDKIRLHHYFLRDRHFMRTVKAKRRQKFGHDPNYLQNCEIAFNKEKDTTIVPLAQQLRDKIILADPMLYLELNPDLQENGIATTEEAWLHWWQHGRWEGRRIV